MRCSSSIILSEEIDDGLTSVEVSSFVGSFSSITSVISSDSAVVVSVQVGTTAGKSGIVSAGSAFSDTSSGVDGLGPRSSTFSSSTGALTSSGLMSVDSVFSFVTSDESTTLLSDSALFSSGTGSLPVSSSFSSSTFGAVDSAGISKSSSTLTHSRTSSPAFSHLTGL